jgi:glycine/D-amino acid oxidase-like deaminating enzyme
MLTRRDLLAAFLGAPFAALACAREPRTELPPGEIVGASDAVGHRLRVERHEMPNDWTAHDVVIVGAGAAGLAAAWRLAQAGMRDVVVLELESVEGGTARSGSNYPWGAHYVPAPMRDDVLLIQLLREMNVIESFDANGEPVIGEEFLVRDPDERIFFRGRWYEGLYLAAGASDDDLRQLHAFDAEIDKWVAWRDGKGRRAFAIPTALCSNDAEAMALDRMTMREWLDARRFTSPRLRWLVEYACRDDYGSLLDDTSAWAGIFYFASRVAAPGKASQPLIAWPEGNGRLIKHLANGKRIDRGWLVTKLIARENGVDVFALARDGRTLRGIHAKRVIFAGPQFIAARVIDGYRDVHEFVYGSWLVANLTLKDRPKSEGFPLAWDNVLYDSPSLGYVVATHQSGIDYGPTVLTYYYALCDRDPRHAREQLLSAGRDEWAEVVLSDLERAHRDIRKLVTRLDVMRWGHAMIRPHPGLRASLAQAREPMGNIHFAHSDLSGVALFEEALHHGVRAADEVLSGRGLRQVSF